ncbi:major facilitator superfamily domain-containing protein [Rhizoctonia solani]|nr:major facilitator superfamily domain-containing protein [Rhizoctonia solani]
MHVSGQVTPTSYIGTVLEQDIEKFTLRVNANPDPSEDLSEEKVKEPERLQTTSPSIQLVEQAGQDEFIEGGVEGWKAVLGCTLVVAATAGTMMWGVFQAYHSKTLFRGTPDATLSAIGAIQNALMTGLAFRFIGAGCIVVFLGQFGAAWCHDLWSVFLTQGVLQGLGCGLLLPMIFAIPSQWFRRRRGVATGIVIAGSSLGAAIPSLVVQTMLEHIGFHKTLLIYSFVQGVTMLVGFFLIKIRIPESQAQNRHRKIVWVDKQYLKDPVFWSFCTALIFTIFGFMIPFVFISVYTREKLPHFIFSSGIWNVAAESYPGIMASLLFGLTGPCFISLVTPVAVTLYGIHNLATLTGLLNMSYLPGSISGPPLGGVILANSGRNWHALAAYSGLIQLLGVLCMLYARFKREKRLFAKI